MLESTPVGPSLNIKSRQGTAPKFQIQPLLAHGSPSILHQREELEAELREAMLRSLNGDKPAYEKMLLTISTMIRGYVMNSLGSRFRTEETVDDVIQDVLLSIHRKKHLYRADMPILPWLFAITRYRLIDYVRAEKRRPLLEGWEETFDAPEPERIELSAERLFELEEILDGLNPRQKQILIMAKADGLPLAEIAERLNMSLAAVKVAIHRCIQTIRKRAQNEM